MIPNWADSTWNRTYTLNARIETLDQKRPFQDITDNRCLILVNGFYEWQPINNSKIKYEIGFNEILFVLARLFDENKNTNTYTIITTEAKGIMRKIHNTKLRISFALQSKSEMNAWLHGDRIEPNYDFTTLPEVYDQTILF